MDKITLIGLILGISAIVLGQVLEGGHVASLLQPTAFLIVMGGTFGAVLVQSPLTTFTGGLRMLKWLIIPPKLQLSDMIDMMTHFSRTARKDGLLALEGYIGQMEDPFIKRGLQMLIDGIDPEQIREILEVEISSNEEHLKQKARVWESAGGYAPTIGILGAVMGLIHVMENLSDPSRLGAGIAVAFVATIYGVGSANLIFLPAAKKLLVHIGRITSYREMLVDGLVGIAMGENPRIIEGRMQGYL